VTGYRIADDVAWVSLEALDIDGVPSAYVTRMPHGRPLTLEGSACLVWLALADGGTLDEIATAAASMSDAAVERVRSDVATMVEDLVRRGLATRG
jgi:hypothetical protein